MSLRHILLGILAEPASGYQIKQYFNASLRHFWSAELAQVYPTLHKLEKDGLLESKLVPPEKGPPQRIYQRTQAGAGALLDWLQEPVTGTERFTYLAQVFFLGDHSDPQVGLRFFKDLKKQFEQRLQTLHAIHQGWLSEDPGMPESLDAPDLYRYFTLSLGIRRNEATVEWCHECLALLEQLLVDRSELAVVKN